MLKKLEKYGITGLLIFSLAYSTFTPALGQDTDELDSLLNATLAYDSLLLDELASDSLSLIALIDSLVNTDYRFSAIALRTSYISDIVHAGRDFGVNQYGFSGGISYYHKSGIFSDLNGYWNSDIDPKYHLTTASLGYMNEILPKWSIIGSYEHYFYNETATEQELTNPLTNAINVNTYYELGFVSPGIDYSFLFGSETAHRIRPNIFATIRFKKAGFIDELSFHPSASMLLGNQTIYYLNMNYDALKGLIQKIGRLRFLRLYRNNPELIEELIYQEEFDPVFGIMNYSFSLPANLSVGKFSLSAGYFLNFPVALPGEEIDLSPNHYFNLTLLYFITW